MTKETLKKYDGIKDAVKKSKSIHSVYSWLPIFINFDEEKIKTEKENSGDFELTKLIRPCTEDEIMETIIRMLSY